jgi:hypothetical protein
VHDRWSEDEEDSNSIGYIAFLVQTNSPLNRNSVALSMKPLTKTIVSNVDK